MFLSVVASSISIASFATLTGVPAETIEASCGVTFSITTGFIKILLKTKRKKKKNTTKLLC